MAAGPGIFLVQGEFPPLPSLVPRASIRERLSALGWETHELYVEQILASHTERWSVYVSRLGATADEAHRDVFATFQSFGYQTSTWKDWAVTPVKAIRDAAAGTLSTIGGGVKGVGIGLGLGLTFVGLLAAVLVLRR